MSPYTKQCCFPVSFLHSGTWRYQFHFMVLLSDVHNAWHWLYTGSHTQEASTCVSGLSFWICLIIKTLTCSHTAHNSLQSFTHKHFSLLLSQLKTSVLPHQFGTCLQWEEINISIQGIAVIASPTDLVWTLEMQDKKLSPTPCAKPQTLFKHKRLGFCFLFFVMPWNQSSQYCFYIQVISAII